MHCFLEGREAKNTAVRGMRFDFLRMRLGFSCPGQPYRTTNGFIECQAVGNNPYGWPDDSRKKRKNSESGSKTIMSPPFPKVVR